MFYPTIKSLAKQLMKYSDLTPEQLFTLCVHNKMDTQIDNYVRRLENEATWAGAISYGEAKITLLKKLITIETKEIQEKNPWIESIGERND